MGGLDVAHISREQNPWASMRKHLWLSGAANSTLARVQWHELSSLPPPPLSPHRSSNSSASASQVSGIIGTCHYSWLIFVFLVEMGFCHVGQAGLELLTSGDPPASASQGARVTAVMRSVVMVPADHWRGSDQVFAGSSLALLGSPDCQAQQNC
ncbi:hypothetical protein AAY473_026398 [Plecturocebus cupreus]